MLSIHQYLNNYYTNHSNFRVTNRKVVITLFSWWYTQSSCMSSTWEDWRELKRGSLSRLAPRSTLKADFQSSHEAPRSSLRVHAWALSSNRNAKQSILIRYKHSQRAARTGNPPLRPIVLSKLPKCSITWLRTPYQEKLFYIYNIRFHQNINFRPDKIVISPNPRKIQKRFWLVSIYICWSDNFQLATAGFEKLKK
jgi:hypothetical protein